MTKISTFDIDINTDIQMIKKRKKCKRDPLIFNIGWTKESAGKIIWKKQFKPPNYYWIGGD